MWYTKTVKIPEKHYINFRDPKEEKDPEELKYPLGFMTPHGTDKAFEKRRETVDNWANCGWYRNQKKPYDVTRSKVLDNLPIEGFQLTFDIRNGYTGSPDAWKIADPRGFKLEIRSDNLAQLMKETEIKNGKIIGECVWAREGGRNVLLSVNTEEYKAAVITTKAASTPMGQTVPIKSVKIGSMVTLDNGYKARYLGRMYTYQTGYGQLVETEPSNYVYIFQVMDYRVSRHGKCAKNGLLYTRKSVKVVSVDEVTTLLNDVKAEAFVNELLNAKETAHSDYGVAFYSFDKTPQYKFELVKISTLEDLRKKERRYDQHYYTRVGNDFGQVSQAWGYSANKKYNLELYPLVESDLMKAKATHMRYSKMYPGYMGGSRLENVKVDVPETFDNDVFSLQITISTSVGINHKLMK